MPTWPRNSSWVHNSVNNFTQISIQNKSNGANASADLIAYGDNNTNDTTGFADIGFTSSGFSQAAYAITGQNDGYFFVSAVSGASKTGNMVLATDGTGTTNNILATIPITGDEYSVTNYCNYGNSKNIINNRDFCQFHLVLLDDDGNEIDMNNCHWGCVFELDFITRKIVNVNENDFYQTTELNKNKNKVDMNDLSES